VWDILVGRGQDLEIIFQFFKALGEQGCQLAFVFLSKRKDLLGIEGPEASFAARRIRSGSCGS
jgi:hypothetical protein